MKKSSTKKGAASFYVVAFSTLILLIIVASFTALVIAQITRSSNDDLSQSAYDSALAGVEDAKLAYYSYQNCIAQGAVARSSGTVSVDETGQLTCEDIVTLVEKQSEDCDVVARILGRTFKNENGEEVGVSIEEINGQNSNKMQQYYTCAKLHTSLPDYRATLSSANPMRAIQVKVDDDGRKEEVNVNAIDRVKVSWGSGLSQSDVELTNYDGGQVKYNRFEEDNLPANPPTIAFAFAQAGGDFTMDDFKKVNMSNGEEQSNRGMVYMTPVDVDGNMVSGQEKDTYKTAGFEDGMNKISALDMVKTNTEMETAKNKPFGVSCPGIGQNEFACVTMIDLPRPVGGKRNDGSFIVAVLLPYGAPTDVMLEFFCGTEYCGRKTVFCTEDDSECREDGTKEEKTHQINLMGIQIGVDSTGKANDLFRRVDTRLEGTDSSSLSVMGPLELFGDGSDTNNGDGGNGVSLDKDYAVIKEYNF